MSKQTLHLKDILFLSIVISLFYFIYLGHYPLFTPDEGRYSEVAREMIATGDFITPRVNGVAFLDKPILYYWLQTIAIRTFGLHEWALRFFPALSGVLGCILSYIAGTILFSRRTGLLAAIILATTPLYFGGAHYADLNLEVATFINGALICFLLSINALPRKRFLGLTAAYLFAALAFLTKGMIGIVFPTIIIGIWIALTWQWSLIKKMHLVWGLLLVSAIVIPWYYFAQKANPEFLHFFFVTQQITRFLSHATFNNPLPFWFYLPVVLVGFLPWAFFLFQSIRKAIQDIREKQTTAHYKMYLLIWCSFVFIFFSIPHSKLVGYIFPIFMPLALLTASYLDAKWNHSKYIRFFTPFFTCMMVIFLLSIVYVAPRYNTNSLKSVALILKKQIQPTDEVITYERYYQDLPLYLEKQVTIVANWHAYGINAKDDWMREFELGRQFQDTSGWLIDEKTFWKKWDNHHRLFVFVPKNSWQSFESKAKKTYVIYRDEKVIVFSNQPATH